ncbi:permease prefix domain 1-containing protein [Clostridium folliculivorans]|uniref:Uncharacterized protein n=1 Tax=Clostridium folliculivorans TaxID=2886038 RepID=A0A9W6DBD9_9CLOT|nr:permease prefix domain 1-containing protein [Clostridium folliculivorans]GKU26325.1 hypothetical protein CFOLD11_31520 [Clostridium folliculivorans]GKU32120.1 hypothetical protein CFB3_42280 [Clostridium folliculivorans]
MEELDRYISSIVSDLKISKKRKLELISEFKDHLELLKLQYMSEGYSESEAIRKSIDSFGEIKQLRLNIMNSLSNYRNKITLLFGLLLIIALMFVGNRMPIPGIELTSSSNLLTSSIIFMMLFIPLGYWVPVIFSKAKKKLELLLLALPLTINVIILFSFFMMSSIRINYIMTISISSFIGALIGYILLVSVNKLYMINIKLLTRI